MIEVGSLVLVNLSQPHEFDDKLPVVSILEASHLVGGVKSLT